MVIPNTIQTSDLSNDSEHDWDKIKQKKQLKNSSSRPMTKVKEKEVQVSPSFSSSPLKKAHTKYIK